MSRLLPGFQARRASNGDGAPVRSELFSAERLEGHARTLAAALGPGRRGKGRSLIRRLADNQAVLLEAYEDTARALEEGESITPAAEWLIDNFHLTEEQIREIRVDLPADYYRQLPKIASGDQAGYPRVFGIAWAFVAHTDSRFDPVLLSRFLRAYQEVHPLSIGELWAVAITLRIVLIENLRRIAERIVVSRRARTVADAACNRMLGVSGCLAEPVASVLREHERSALADAFVVQFCQRLRDDAKAGPAALAWLDERLTRQGVYADQVVRSEQQRQVAAGATVRNIIASMRLISDVDWSELVESVSLVDARLRSASQFADMDFPTRNLYRTEIEHLSRGSGRSELEITGLVIKAISEVADQSGESRRCDPGYHLVAGGRAALEASIGFKPPLRRWFGRAIRGLGVGAYVGAGCVTAGVLLGLALLALTLIGTPAIWFVALGITGIFPALDAAVAIINRAITGGFRAVPLPGLELKGGVPQRLRTIVAVPALLCSLEDAEEQIKTLEIHHLSSPDGDLHFALLSDWRDAESESTETDEVLLAAVTQGVARLNSKYGPAPGGDRFLLFHRRRVWSDSEQCWMGWERKRGKLHELNDLLRGAPSSNFIPVENQNVPAAVRFVITLDADTKLPRETVRRLIGKMAHPLNRPHLDPVTGWITEGHGILQPRVTAALPSVGGGSLFHRVFSSPGGIDPYAAAVSDVYQDLFGQGSYAGKGIYDIDAFETALRGRTPDSTLLSHDLFEGVFARAGLASDVEVVDEFPDRYDLSTLRQHRWARGDWQLLPWILGVQRPSTSGSSKLPMIGRWKMVDNLRRTLSPGLALASLLVGWWLPFQGAVIWTSFILMMFLIPPLIPIAASAARRSPGVPFRARLRTLGGDLRLALLQVALVTTLLADQAWLMGDAILRTLWRITVSRRHLLEWTPSAQAATSQRLEIVGFYRRMAPAAALGIATFAAAWLGRSMGWSLATPFALVWMASPAVAYLVSRPIPPSKRPAANEGELRRLRLTARRTWRYFERFVTPADNMLPPDNFQQTPEALAHRTSPTNMGLYLLSIVAARDFGWVGVRDAVTRLEETLATMDRMARHRGHFFNWYDTRDLRPLDPQYVSSVDSGNLAGHLVAVANAMQEWEAPSAADPYRGAADALAIATEEFHHLRLVGAAPTASWRRLSLELERVRQALQQAPESSTGPDDGWDGLARQAETLTDFTQAVVIELGGSAGSDLLFWSQAVGRSIQSQRADASVSATERLTKIAARARQLVADMEFGFLLDPDRMLLSIGYRCNEGVRDPSCYDLLGSEARLTSFIAIAKGDVAARHWFKLGHAVTPVGRDAALLSWSGSMFEYLMPSLVMRAPPGSLLDRTERLAAQRQIDYATGLNVPWGISESAYNIRDLDLTYQYLSFGVPSLGLKRGLADSIVIAPYATALAATVETRAAARNFELLESLGAQGRYGFFEALDYTPSRVPEGERFAIVEAFMAHHQGMSIIAIANALHGGRMQDRFHAEPMVRATELLLEERTPREVVVSRPWIARRPVSATSRMSDQPGGRRISTPHSPTPEVHLLSNGRYTVMLTSAGGGYSRWKDVALTRWREDATRDDFGSHIYLRDVKSGALWSAGYLPTAAPPDDYRVVFNEDRGEISRRDGSILTVMEVLVSAEDDAEVRRISLTNTGFTSRELEVTSYAEIALAPQAADVAHPAFSKLFVETEHLPALGALLATRRRRSHNETEVWAGHLSVLEGEAIGRQEFTTDRAQFLGRGRGARAPHRLQDGLGLGGATGAVLDPAFVLRRRVRIPPGGTVRVSFWTLAATSRAALLDLIDKHHDPSAYDRAADLAWTQSLVQLHHFGVERREAALFQRLAGHLIYAGSGMRASSGVLRKGLAGQPELWRLSLSGDLPIVLVRVADEHDLGLARQLTRAAEYWRAKHLGFDLVLLNEQASSYVQDLQVALESLARGTQPRIERSSAGGTLVLRADLIGEASRDLLVSVARIVLVGQAGTLAQQLERSLEAVAPPSAPPRRRSPASDVAHEATPQLEFFNGLGGFADNGREYVVVMGPGQVTPAPWINVIANPNFGFQVSADGAGYTWSRSSRERQLTPWSNDPVSDPAGEALYLRDEETGEIWSPTAAPIRDVDRTYTARHGRGYSRFISRANGVDLELLQFVPQSDPVKISRLRLRNTGGRARRLSLTAYVEWVLGPTRAAVAPFTVTERDPATGALFAANGWDPAFEAGVAFADLGGRQTSWTCDRREFIGRNGSLHAPAALARTAPLSGASGVGLDPCAALQTIVDLEPNAVVDLVFLLGEASDEGAARTLVERYRSADLDAELEKVRGYWDRLLGGVQVRTPDRALDVMLNGWLVYQAVACRLWARSAFYQSSGAYGFRDQLQDSMALTAIDPKMSREHLLRAAARQFVEGDVQHWWQPNSGRGVRTRISDDRVWLAITAAHYVSTSQDLSVLDESVPFLSGPRLELGESERYFQPSESDESASLYEHCARALDHSLELGGHGIPLIGSGDWNDGMNRVGERGLGESVWLGWLLHAALEDFIPLANARGDKARVRMWKAHAAGLAAAIEREAWDGDWYRRGWFDDGSVLGSSVNDECRIDSIAQSWAVLSGVAPSDRATRAMAAVERELIISEQKLALLFAPPFDKTTRDPGYVRSYPPGIRENGGQYTHAAAWAVMAFAALGDGDRAGALFAMLNPINHALTRTDAHRYKVEPYVVAADVYSALGHVGRGGWTWYTGSAAWMQRAGVESILGLRREGSSLTVAPCIPRAWPGFTISIRVGASLYEVVVENPDGVMQGVRSAHLDGVAVAGVPTTIALEDDGSAHRLVVRMG